MALAIERTAGAERELAEEVLQLGERHSAEHDVFDLTPACWTCQTHYRFGRVLGVDRGVSAGHLQERRRRSRGAGGRTDR